jgi:hypothetical protein
MVRDILFAAIVLGCAVAPANAADVARTTNLTANEIVTRNAASRGGLQAWRNVQTLLFEGTLGAGGDQRSTVATPESAKVSAGMPAPKRLSEEARLPFTMEFQRPRKSRLEIRFRGQSAIQVYDGANGWKVRPFLNRLDVEPYTAEELRLASAQSDLDGPLIDSTAKGTRVDLEGLEDVEKRPTYKLKLTTKDGQIIHVWIDRETFLETKIEGQPRKLDGKVHPVEIYYRDYRDVDGLQIPFVLETRVMPLGGEGHASGEPRVPPEKIQIEKAVINPKFDAARFSKPQIR